MTVRVRHSKARHVHLIDRDPEIKLVDKTASLKTEQLSLPLTDWEEFQLFCLQHALATFDDASAKCPAILTLSATVSDHFQWPHTCLLDELSSPLVEIDSCNCQPDKSAVLT